jgi:hypothetical protein
MTSRNRRSFRRHGDAEQAMFFFKVLLAAFRQNKERDEADL